MGSASKYEQDIEETSFDVGSSLPNISYLMWRNTPSFSYGDISHTLFPRIWHYRGCISFR